MKGTAISFVIVTEMWRDDRKQITWRQHDGSLLEDQRNINPIAEDPVGNAEATAMKQSATTHMETICPSDRQRANSCHFRYGYPPELVCNFSGGVRDKN